MRTFFITTGKLILSVAAMVALTFALIIGYVAYPEYAGPLFHAVMHGEPAVRLLKTIYWSDLIFTLFHALVPLCALFLLLMLIRLTIRKIRSCSAVRHWLHTLVAAVCWFVVSLGIVLFAACSFADGESLLYALPVGFSHEELVACREDLRLLQSEPQTVTTRIDGSEKWQVFAGGYYHSSSRQPRRPLFYATRYGDGVKAPVELYIETRPLTQYEISYLPNTKIAVSFERVAPPEPSANEWVYGYLRYPKSRGTAVTETGEAIKILGWESLSENQRRLFDLLLSGQLDGYEGDSLPADAWSELLTPEERGEVSVLFDRYQYSAYGCFPHKLYYPDGQRSRFFGGSSHFSRALRAQPEAIRAFSEKAQEIMASIPPDLTQYEKALWLAEYLVFNTEYRAGESDQLAYGCLVEGECVCAGYADAYAVLLYRAGIPCVVVSSETHAWNLVLIDGQYGYVDTTWMDGGIYCDYEYFMESYEATPFHLVPDEDLAEFERLLGLLAGQ